MNKLTIETAYPLQQVAYIPAHAKGDIKHPDVQFGFITSIQFDFKCAFVRYWTDPAKVQLRTTANSERADFEFLFPLVSTSEATILDAIIRYDIPYGENI